jgi:drug/metabolite transporter (DMT)-like permease
MDMRALAMGLMFATIWSSAFTSARIIVADASPLAALSVRFLISGAIALVLARALGESLVLTRAQWRATIIFGICQNALYLGLNWVAMQTLEASVAAIIASTMPLLVAAAGWAFAGERIGPLGTAGLIAGFAGVALIMSTRISGGADPVAMGLCAIGALALTFATLVARGAMSGGNIWTVVGMQMLVGGVALLPPALLFEDWHIAWNGPVIAAYLYTIFMPGLVATFIWLLLVRRIGATRASTFHFLNPFLGVAIAALLLGEALGPLDIAGDQCAGRMKVPLRRSRIAWRNSSWVFITMGPCQATGSCSGAPAISRNRTPSGPGRDTVTSSPVPKFTSVRSPDRSRMLTSRPITSFSSRTPRGAEASAKRAAPANT